MLGRLDIDEVQSLGNGLDSPTGGVARLFTIDVDDNGEIVLTWTWRATPGSRCPRCSATGRATTTSET